MPHFVNKHLITPGTWSPRGCSLQTHANKLLLVFSMQEACFIFPNKFNYLYMRKKKVPKPLFNVNSNYRHDSQRWIEKLHEAEYKSSEERNSWKINFYWSMLPLMHCQKYIFFLLLLVNNFNSGVSEDRVPFYEHEYCAILSAHMCTMCISEFLTGRIINYQRYVWRSDEKSSLSS